MDRASGSHAASKAARASSGVAQSSAGPSAHSACSGEDSAHSDAGFIASGETDSFTGEADGVAAKPPDADQVHTGDHWQ